mmetsp:Transcript_46048/g.74064  ORF Transcript_46048/g.74064 Transcript_46048/m.74064 type:complete len:157 (-) Transcript_46048:109-579(-)
MLHHIDSCDNHQYYSLKDTTKLPIMAKKGNILLDATFTFFSPDLMRWFKLIISRRHCIHHLVVLWVPATAEENGISDKEGKFMQMEVKFPFENDEFVTFLLNPSRFNPDFNMEGNVVRLINNDKSFIVPLEKWNRQLDPIFIVRLVPSCFYQQDNT